VSQVRPRFLRPWRIATIPHAADNPPSSGEEDVMDRKVHGKKIEAEIDNLISETMKLNAEAVKLMAEAAKMRRETAWIPFLLGTATLGAAIGLVKLFLY
jgi:hypothetical protein